MAWPAEDRRGQGARQVEGGVPVMGQGSRAAGVVARQLRVGGQRLAVGGMEPDPLPRQHVLVDRVPGERVPELIPWPALVDHEQVSFHGLAQGGEQLRLGQARHHGQQPVGHLLPGDRGGAQQPLGGLAQRVDPAQQDVNQRGRQVRRVAAPADHPGELLHQVGVAAGPVVDQVHQPGPGSAARIAASWVATSSR